MDVCYNLNSLTTNEYITIIASLKYVYDEKFQCFEESKYAGLSDSAFKNRLISFKATNLCDKIGDKPPHTGRHTHNNISFLTCVCNFYNPQINTLCDLESLFFKHGPNDTIYMENLKNSISLTRNISNKLRQTFKIIRSFINELEAIKLQEHEQRIKNGR